MGNIWWQQQSKVLSAWQMFPAVVKSCFHGQPLVFDRELGNFCKYSTWHPCLPAPCVHKYARQMYKRAINLKYFKFFTLPKPSKTTVVGRCAAGLTVSNSRLWEGRHFFSCRCFQPWSASSCAFHASGLVQLCLLFRAFGKLCILFCFLWNANNFLKRNEQS